MIAMIAVTDDRIEQFTPSDMLVASKELARLIEAHAILDLMEVRDGR